MSVINGLSSNINGVSTGRKWSISSTNDMQVIIASNTKGATTRLAGNEDWTGTYDAFGYTPGSLPGEAFSFEGCITATEGAIGTAIIDEVTIEVDIEAAAVITHSVKFSGNSVLILGSVTQTEDTTDVDKPSSIGCKLEVSLPIAVPSFTEIDDIRTMSLTITTANPSYASSATSGGMRRIAGNLDFAFSFTRYTADPDDLLDAGSVHDVKMFVSATDFWHLMWVRFGDASGIDVDRETGNLVGVTQSGAMEGITDVAGTMTEGFIKTAESTPVTIWP